MSHRHRACQISLPEHVITFSTTKNHSVCLHFLTLPVSPDLVLLRLASLSSPIVPRYIVFMHKGSFRFGYVCVLVNLLFGYAILLYNATVYQHWCTFVQSNYFLTGLNFWSIADYKSKLQTVKIGSIDCALLRNIPFHAINS